MPYLLPYVKYILNASLNCGIVPDLYKQYGRDIMSSAECLTYTRTHLGTQITRLEAGLLLQPSNVERQCFSKFHPQQVSRMVAMGGR